MTRKTDERDRYGYRTHSARIDDQNWFYEERTGMCIVHQVLDGGVLLRSDTINIPWAKILRAVDSRLLATKKKPARRDDRWSGQ